MKSPFAFLRTWASQGKKYCTKLVAVPGDCVNAVSIEQEDILGTGGSRGTKGSERRRQLPVRPGTGSNDIFPRQSVAEPRRWRQSKRTPYVYELETDARIREESADEAALGDPGFLEITTSGISGCANSFRTWISFCYLNSVHIDSIKLRNRIDN